MARRLFIHTYEDVISLENLLEAWQEFEIGKSSRRDVLEFKQHLMSHLIALHQDLANSRYFHGSYFAFRITDPKPREIHKASVRDRVLHRALYRALYPYFDRQFIFDSYSCRDGKGTQKAINRFRSFGYVVSQNHTRTAWVLKCDIRKFFASISHQVLIGILRRHITDERILLLLWRIIGSFSSGKRYTGLPLGNLTSQLFANVYMNEFDQYMKHGLKAQYYIRYADDFAVVSHDRCWLESVLPHMQSFLSKRLRLQLHPGKVWIKTLASGVDFLGWIHFIDHRVLRTATKRRMLNQIQRKKGDESTVQSYLGLMSHGNTQKLGNQVIQKVRTFTKPPHLLG